jgi:3-oxoacyl-[acyl-carrier protein] reductase
MTRTLDLGIAGRLALVCGSSAGLGRACATALANAGVRVWVNGRDADRLHDAAREIAAQTGADVHPVVADVTTAAGRTALLAACPAPDILVNNAAGPKPGNFPDWDEAAWEQALASNMVAPLMLIRATLGPMVERRWGRVINITSSAVKAPLPMLGLSNGARSGLTGCISGLAREVACHGITMNNLLPGRFATDRLRAYAGALALEGGTTLDEATAKLKSEIPVGRFGDPVEFGQVCAFLASVHAGYITGQNLLLDGGTYPGVL